MFVRWGKGIDNSWGLPGGLVTPQKSADGLIALQRRGEAAILLGRIALQELLLGENGIVVAAIGERADHGAARAFACAFNKSAQFVLAGYERLAARREIIAVVKRVAAGIDK